MTHHGSRAGHTTAVVNTRENGRIIETGATMLCTTASSAEGSRADAYVSVTELVGGNATAARHTNSHGLTVVSSVQGYPLSLRTGLGATLPKTGDLT